MPEPHTVPKPRALLVMDRRSLTGHFDAPRLDRLRRLATLPEPIWTDELDSPSARARLRDVDILVTSWGAPALTPDRLAAAPGLRAVFHCAGTVRPLLGADPWPLRGGGEWPLLGGGEWPLLGGGEWPRGIRVTSAADANAIPVAEYTLAAIIFAGKKAPFLAGPEARDRQPNLSNYARTIGVVGFSRIGRRVVDLLGRLDSSVRLVADPYADPSQVATAGGTLIDLYEMLPRSEILTLHAPALPSTRHMLGPGELALLPDGATVINTARGSLIDTAALAAECGAGRLYAVLDVTDPEPLPASHPLRHLPNVFITPHIAGSLGTEILRLTDYALDDLTRWIAGEPMLGEVTPDAYPLRA